MPTPVKGLAGCDVAALDFAATVVQLCPSDMEEQGLYADSVVRLRGASGGVGRSDAILGFGRCWPQRSVKPGFARLGWALFQPNTSVFEAGNVVLRVEPLGSSVADAVQGMRVAKSITLCPFADIADSFKGMSLEGGASMENAVSKPLIDPKALVMHSAKKVLRGSVVCTGLCIAVRLHGDPTAFQIMSIVSDDGDAAAGGEPAATGQLYTVADFTVVSVQLDGSTDAPVAATEVAESVPGAQSAPVSTPSRGSGVGHVVDTVVNLMRMPLFQSGLFTKLGLQPYRFAHSCT